MIIALLVLLVSQGDQEKSNDFCRVSIYNKRETMSERVSNNYGEQMLCTDRCKSLFGSEGVCRCDNCEKFRKDKGLGDFICRHIRGYKEAPTYIRRCSDCEAWRLEKGLTSNFWCKHSMFQKEDWDRSQGW